MFERILLKQNISSKRWEYVLFLIVDGDEKDLCVDEHRWQFDNRPQT